MCIFEVYSHIFKKSICPAITSTAPLSFPTGRTPHRLEHESFVLHNSVPHAEFFAQPYNCMLGRASAGGGTRYGDDASVEP